MNFKKSILLAALLLATGSSAVFAQASNVKKAKTNLAKFEDLKKVGTAALGKASLTSAQEAVDAAVVHEKTSSDAEAWTYYALVYANIAFLETDADAATKASEGIKKASEFDADQKNAENIGIAKQTLGQFKFNQGVGAWDKEDYKTAYEDFNAALSYLPGDTTLTFYTGLAAVQNKDYDNAIPRYLELVPVKNYSSHRTIMVDLPKLYMSKGDTTNALKSAADAAAAYPNDKDAITQNIEFNLITGNEAKILTDIEAQIAKDPQNKNLLYYSGLAHGTAGNSEKALAAYKKALEIDPNYIEANINAAVIIMNSGRDELLAINDDSKLTTAEYNKKLAEVKGKIATALPYLQKTIELDPSNKDALRSLKSYYDFIEDEAKSKEIQAKLESLN